MPEEQADKTRRSRRTRVRGRVLGAGVCVAAAMGIGFALHSAAQPIDQVRQHFRTRSVVQEGMELLPNPLFAQNATGWMLRFASPDARQGHGGSAVVRLDGGKPGPKSWSYMGIAINSPPSERALKFQCWLLAQDAQQETVINAFAYDANGETVADYLAHPKVTNGTWQPFTAEYVVPPDARRLAIWIGNQTTRPLFVSDSHLQVGVVKKAPLSKRLNGVGVLRAVEQKTVRARKEGQSGVVTFPIPGTYRDQVPLSFNVQTTPAKALQGFKWRKRADGNNWLCDVRVAPTGKGCLIKYEALVLVGTHTDPPLPRVLTPEIPPQTKVWTRSTACVQSDDPAIKAKAAELSHPGQDIEAYARQVTSFTSKNKGKPDGVWYGLDARNALDCGGSCTNRANLAAALLRARGIPARTISHLPTWSGPLYEHWLVEYWHPGVGWVWLESTLGKFQPQPWTLAVLGIANPEDEDMAFDPVHVQGMIPGAPYQVCIEADRNLYKTYVPGSGSSNSAVPVCRIEGSVEEITALFAAARRAFPTLAAQNEAGKNAPGRAKQIEAAAASGPHALTSLLQTVKTAAK